MGGPYCLTVLHRNSSLFKGLPTQANTAKSVLSEVFMATHWKMFFTSGKERNITFPYKRLNLTFAENETKLWIQQDFYFLVDVPYFIHVLSSRLHYHTSILWIDRATTQQSTGWRNPWMWRMILLTRNILEVYSTDRMLYIFHSCDYNNPLKKETNKNNKNHVQTFLYKC